MKASKSVTSAVTNTSLTYSTIFIHLLSKCSFEDYDIAEMHHNSQGCCKFNDDITFQSAFYLTWCFIILNSYWDNAACLPDETKAKQRVFSVAFKFR